MECTALLRLRFATGDECGFCAALLLLPRVAGAQGTLEDYRRAATINAAVRESHDGSCQGEAWIGRTNQAVYRVTVPGGNRFVRVDAEQWSKQPAFDHAAVATRSRVHAVSSTRRSRMPFQSIAFVENGTAYRGNARRSRYRCTDRGHDVHAGRRSDAGGVAGAARGRWWGGGRGGAEETRRAAQAKRADSRASQDRSFLAGLPDGRVHPELQRRDSASARPGFAGRGWWSWWTGRRWSRGWCRDELHDAEHGWVRRRRLSGQLDRVVAGLEEAGGLPAEAGLQPVPHYIQSSPSDQVQPKLLSYGEAPGNFGGGIYRKAGDQLDSNQPAVFDTETKRQILIDRSLFRIRTPSRARSGARTVARIRSITISAVT
jgi:hypothetical protein